MWKAARTPSTLRARCIDHQRPPHLLLRAPRICTLVRIRCPSAGPFRPSTWSWNLNPGRATCIRAARRAALQQAGSRTSSSRQGCEKSSPRFSPAAKGDQRRGRACRYRPWRQQWLDVSVHALTRKPCGRCGARTRPGHGGKRYRRPQLLDGAAGCGERLCMLPRIPARMRWCPGPKGVPATNGHRLGGTPVRLAQRQPRIHGMQLKEILALRPPSWPGPRIDRHFDLIKMDGDGPEGIWLEYLAQQVSKGSISIDTLTLEANGIRSSSMRRFQHEFGYTVLRLDFAAADPRRFITSKGWDAYSPRGTFAPLSRFGAHERDDLEEEVFSVRAMRRVFLIKPNLTEAQWKVVLTPSKQKRPGSVLQFVITRQSGLLNPVLGGQYRRSDAWIASRYVPPEHGLD